jgi:Response regulator receiver domain
MGTLREIAPGTLVIAVGPPERRRPSTGRRWRWPAAPRPLATYAPGRFDVILTNVGMPAMTGWELVERIRATDGAVPVFLITGWGLLDGERIARSPCTSNACSTSPCSPRSSRPPCKPPWPRSDGAIEDGSRIRATHVRGAEAIVHALLEGGGGHRLRTGPGTHVATDQVLARPA